MSHPTVEMALADPEWGEMSDRAVADKVGVSDPFVGRIREELQTVCSSKAEAKDAKRTGKDGKKRKAPKKRQAKVKAGNDASR